MRISEKNAALNKDYLYIIPSFKESNLATDVVYFCNKETAERLPNSNLIYTEQTYAFSHLWNVLLEAFDYYNDNERKFMEIVHQKSSLQEAIDLMSAMLDNPTYMVDASFKVLAMDQRAELPLLSINWKRVRDFGYLPASVVSELFEDPHWIDIIHETGAVITSTKQFSVPFIIYHLRLADWVIGHFFVSGILQKTCEADLDIVNLFGSYLLEICQTDESFSLIHGQYYEHFLQNMLDGRIDNEEFIVQQLDSLGWKYKDYYCILVIDIQEHNWTYYEFIFSRIPLLRNGKSLRYHNYLVYILPVHDMEHFDSYLDTIKKSLEQIHHTGGISDLFQQFQDLHYFFVQAETALEYGKEADSSIVLHKYENYCTNHLLSCCGQTNEMLSFVHSGIFMLMDNEQQLRTEFIETLYQFLRHNQNLVRTAKILNIHRNTLVYRLGRIRDILNINFDDADICFRLLMSIKIVQMYNKEKL